MGFYERMGYRSRGEYYIKDGSEPRPALRPVSVSFTPPGGGGGEEGQRESTLRRSSAY